MLINKTAKTIEETVEETFKLYFSTLSDSLLDAPENPSLHKLMMDEITVRFCARIICCRSFVLGPKHLKDNANDFLRDIARYLNQYIDELDQKYEPLSPNSDPAS